MRLGSLTSDRNIHILTLLSNSFVGARNIQACSIPKYFRRSKILGLQYLNQTLYFFNTFSTLFSTGNGLSFYINLVFALHITFLKSRYFIFLPTFQFCRLNASFKIVAVLVFNYNLVPLHLCLKVISPLIKHVLISAHPFHFNVSPFTFQMLISFLYAMLASHNGSC